MDAKLDKILNLCYELEGLLCLAKKRDDIIADIMSKARNKTDEIRSLFDSDISISKSDNAITTIELDDNEQPEVLCQSELPDEITDSHESDDPTEQSRNLRQIFTINDKFRFRRELFGNSDTEFADCLNLLSAMTSIAEVHEYLFNDLEWDKSNDEVVEFVTIIETYFKNKHKG